MSDPVDLLESALPGCVSRSEADRARHRRDTWVLNELRDLEGTPPPLPLAVVTPRDSAGVATALRVCRENGVPVVPFGGGSGVVGGIETGAGVVVLSTAGLEGLVEIDDTNLLARFRAGTNGMEAERCVQKAGLTIGHWPQSIELSTVGGWVATRAAGQFSTAYGNVEDVVFALEAVLPDGTVVRTRETPRAAAGPDLRQILMGSEGTLGVVTEVTFSLRPLPETRRPLVFHYPSLADAVDPLRRVLRAGHRPPVARLYDAAESQRNFGDWCPEDRALLILLHEGPAATVAAEADAVTALCQEAGGAPGDPAAVEHWLERRNHVPGFRGFLEKGIILDTIEVGCTWDRTVPIYDAVTASLREVEGLLTASAHSSHSYRSGTNLYFTFAARPADRTRMSDIYRECWQRTMDATLAAGGGIAHHHGIGRVRRDSLPGELGPGGMTLLRAVKRALDPDDLLNPGVLLPTS